MTLLSDHDFWSFGTVRLFPDDLVPDRADFVEAAVRSAIRSALPEGLHLAMYNEIRVPAPAGDRGTMLSIKTNPDHKISRELAEWHHDGDYDETNGEVDADDYLIVWSNSLGTELRQHGKRRVYQAAPWEVIAFRNGSFWHRTPPVKGVPLAKIRNRWFVRTFLPGHLTNTPVNLDHEGLYVYEP